MAIRLEDKKAIVAEVNETAGGALSVVMADYRGVTSGDMTALRAKARAENEIGRASCRERVLRTV